MDDINKQDDLIDYYKECEELPGTLSGCFELINLLYGKINQLEEQIEQMKKDYPFFDDSDGENYTLKDGKALEGK